MEKELDGLKAKTAMNPKMIKDIVDKGTAVVIEKKDDYFAHYLYKDDLK